MSEGACVGEIGCCTGMYYLDVVERFSHHSFAIQLEWLKVRSFLARGMFGQVINFFAFVCIKKAFG